MSKLQQKTVLTDCISNIPASSTAKFDLKYALENLLGRDVDLLEGKAVRNPYLKESIDTTKVQLYG